MRHGLVTTIIIVLLVGCKATPSEETSETAATDSTAFLQANDEPSENTSLATSSEAGYRGIIIDNDVPIWADTSRSEEYIAMVNRGDQVVVLNEYPGLVNPWSYEGTPYCDQMGYHFYEVKVMQGDQEIQGVIYGSNVFLEPQGYEAFRGIRPTVIENQVLEINGTGYEFGVVVSDGIGPSNSEGLTGCDDTYLPYFRNISTNEVRFIMVTEPGILEQGDSHMRYFNGFLQLVWGSEGGSCVIQSIDQAKCNGEWSVVMELESGYQDGGAKFTMCVTHANGNFSLLTVYKN